jgi:hypothetical protein
MQAGGWLVSCQLQGFTHFRSFLLCVNFGPPLHSRGSPNVHFGMASIQTYIQVSFGYTGGWGTCTGGENSGDLALCLLVPVLSDPACIKPAWPRRSQVLPRSKLHAAGRQLPRPSNLLLWDCCSQP